MPRRPTIMSDPGLLAQAISLAKQGHRRDYIARELNQSNGSVNHFLDRFDLCGEDGVMPRSTKKTYSQQTKLDAVNAYLAGDTAVDVARRFGIPTSSQIYDWARIYRNQGPDGLAWRRRGRPSMQTIPVEDMTEVQKLAAEVEMLKAENAYLKALAALEAAEQMVDEQDDPQDQDQDQDTDTGTPLHD